MYVKQIHLSLQTFLCFNFYCLHYLFTILCYLICSISLAHQWKYWKVFRPSSLLFPTIIYVLLFQAYIKLWPWIDCVAVITLSSTCIAGVVVGFALKVMPTLLGATCIWSFYSASFCWENSVEKLLKTWCNFFTYQV